jgi:hypothetical protein
MVIVESHHKVLSAWAEYRRTLKSPPRLLTLDHHTDTSKPFRDYLKTAPAEHVEGLRSQHLKSIDFNLPTSIESAMEKLSNDEHVVTAIQTGILSSALVIAHNAYDTNLQIYEEHKIICRSISRNGGKVTRTDCDRVLESEFLDDRLQSFNLLLKKALEPELEKAPYIFDIDLDYLNTLNSIRPQDASTLQSLVKNAGLVTIATEPVHVKNCALDLTLSSELLLSGLLELISD